MAFFMASKAIRGEQGWGWRELVLSAVSTGKSRTTMERVDEEEADS
jgi:hypothetical protein